MMCNEKKVERIKHNGFQGKEKAFIALQSDPTRLWGIIAISNKGLRFRYIPGLVEIKSCSGLDIVTADTTFRMGEIPFRVIWDSEIVNGSRSDHGLRCCGVEFENLESRQKSQLEHFIKTCTKSS